MTSFVINLNPATEQRVRLHAVAIDTTPEKAIETAITVLYGMKGRKGQLEPVPITPLRMSLASDKPDEYRTIAMARGQFALVDPDFAMPLEAMDTGYQMRGGYPARIVQRDDGKGGVLIQRLACDALGIDPGRAPGLVIKYYNDNPLDCRRLNLMVHWDNHHKPLREFGLYRCNTCGRCVPFTDLIPASAEFRDVCKACAGDTALEARTLTASRGHNRQEVVSNEFNT